MLNDIFKLLRERTSVFDWQIWDVRATEEEYKYRANESTDLSLMVSCFVEKNIKKKKAFRCRQLLRNLGIKEG